MGRGIAMNSSIHVLVLGSILAIVLSACGSGNTHEGHTVDTKQPAQATAGAGAGGEALYKANCIACHGANLEGTLGPNLQKIGAKSSKDQMVAKIQNGTGSMPAFKGRLKDTDIESISEWLSGKK
jgi:cytochrome c551